MRFVRIDTARGGTSVIVRNHQVREFFPAVGPGSGIVEVQTFGLPGSVSPVSRELGTAAHGMPGIFVCRYELVGIGPDSGQSEEEQEE